MLAPTFERPEEREFVVDSGASMYMMSKKEWSSSRIGYFAKIQEPHCGAYSHWRSAYKRGGTRIRSQYKSIRDGAITRRHACSSITWKPLRRTRIHLWMGQQSKTTVEQRGNDNFTRNEQLRTSCCSRVIDQFWEQFVVNIDIAGFVNKSSSRAKWRTSATRVVRIILRNPKQKQKEEWQSRCGRPFARSSWKVGGVHR